MKNDKRMNKEKKWWESHAPGYDKRIEKDWKIYPTLLDKVYGDIKADGTVLDVATGTGAVALKIAKRAKQVYAVDISSSMVQEAEKKMIKAGIGNVEFSVQDAYFLPFDDGMFDTVICKNALHNMVQPKKALSEIKRVLKPGGRLLATIAGIGESRKFMLMMTIFRFFTGFPVFYKLNLDETAGIIEESGFAILNKETIKHPEDTFPLIYVVAERVK